MKYYKVNSKVFLKSEFKKINIDKNIQQKKELLMESANTNSKLEIKSAIRVKVECRENEIKDVQVVKNEIIKNEIIINKDYGKDISKIEAADQTMSSKCGTEVMEDDSMSVIVKAVFMTMF
jgi:hypothetical protein